MGDFLLDGGTGLTRLEMNVSHFLTSSIPGDEFNSYGNLEYQTMQICGREIRYQRREIFICYRIRYVSLVILDLNGKGLERRVTEVPKSKSPGPSIQGIAWKSASRFYLHSRKFSPVFRTGDCFPGNYLHETSQKRLREIVFVARYACLMFVRDEIHVLSSDSFAI